MIISHKSLYFVTANSIWQNNIVCSLTNRYNNIPVMYSLRIAEISGSLSIEDSLVLIEPLGLAILVITRDVTTFILSDYISD